MEPGQVPPAEGGPLPEPPQQAEPGQKVFVLPAPGVAAPAEGVLQPLEPGLVAVEEHGRAGEGVEQGGGQLPALLAQPLLLRIQAIDRPLRLLRRGLALAQEAQHPGGIVGAQEIHGGEEGRGGIVLPDGLHALPELRRVPAPEVAEGRRPEGVVHEAVGLAPQQVPPPLGVGDLVAAVLPDLAQKQAPRLGLVHGLTDARDEVVRQLVRHVQPPAVRPGTEPVADDGILPPEDEVPVAGRVLVDGGQVPDAPPGVVVRGPGVEVEPGVVGGILALGRADGAVAAVGVEVAAVPPVVVEDAVQDHPDAEGVGLLAEGTEVLLRPQHGVDPAVVAGIVAVVAAGLEDGAEVEGLHPQLPEVGELPPDAREVPAEEVPAVLAVPVRQIVRDILPVLMEPPSGGHLRHVRQVGAAKAVREDLIGEPLPKPAGGGGGGVIDRHLPAVLGLVGPAGGIQIPDAAVRPGEAEGVPAELRRTWRGEGQGEALPLPVPALGLELPFPLLPGEFPPQQQRAADEALPALRPDVERHRRAQGDGAEGVFAEGAAGIEDKGF